jgi:hypothetical protein
MAAVQFALALAFILLLTLSTAVPSCGLLDRDFGRMGVLPCRHLCTRLVAEVRALNSST